MCLRTNLFRDIIIDYWLVLKTKGERMKMRRGGEVEEETYIALYEDEWW